MIRNWLSRYSFRYPRAIVYMLQASEYNLRDYFAWYHNVKNFANVEQRKQFVKTAKGTLLLVIAWIFIFFIVCFSSLILWFGTFPLKYILAAITLLVAPYLLAYGITVPLFVIRIFIQLPVEYFLIKQARRRLKNHKAVKIGVAGSFGKTTMREILRTVLAEGKNAVAPPHSYNTPLGISQFVKKLSGREEVLIFELGEYYPGDVRKLCNLVQPDIGVITGINEAHLQKFKELGRTAKTIYELADYLQGKPIYVNGESEIALENARPGHTIYSRKGIENWKVKNEKSDLNGTLFTLTGNGELSLKSGLLGLHQIGPLLVAFHISSALGLSHEQIKKGIEKTRPFEHRLEPKIDGTGVITLDDTYNGNPDGVKAAVEFLGSLKAHRRFYVTPGLVEMGSHTEKVHRDIGRNLARACIEKVVLIKNSVTHYIEQGLKEEKYGGEILWFDNALVAFAALPYLTVKGDIVLLQNDWPDQYQ
ncbi:MAG: hypothetical protein HY432_00675 [Candidatus Liptonbacteria bacterium]|nr:hypothetical protein [Candidatus Liptonbacteria bacterium]